LKKIRLRQFRDRAAGGLMSALTALATALVFIVALALLVRARPLLDIKPLAMILAMQIAT
jgi:hypothetical protein